MTTEIARHIALIDELSTYLFQRLTKAPYADHPKAHDLYRAILGSTRLQDGLRERFADNREMVLEKVDELFPHDQDIHIDVQTIRLQIAKLRALNDGLTDEQRAVVTLTHEVKDAMRELVMLMTARVTDAEALDAISSVVESLSHGSDVENFDLVAIDIVLNTIEKSPLDNAKGVHEACAGIREMTGRLEALRQENTRTFR